MAHNGTFFIGLTGSGEGLFGDLLVFQKCPGSSRASHPCRSAANSEAIYVNLRAFVSNMITRLSLHSLDFSCMPHASKVPSTLNEDEYLILENEVRCFVAYFERSQDTRS